MASIITPTKTSATLQSTTTNAAGGTTTGTGRDLRTTRGGLATLVITNGATGPTVPCQAVLQVSADNTTFYDYQVASGTSVNSDVTTVQFHVPETVMYARSQFRGNTGQGVTVLAIFEEYTNDSAT